MLLINSSAKDALKIFQPFYPIHPPIGLGYLLSALEGEGIKTKLIDEQVEDNVLGLANQYVKGLEPPYIFGFSVLTASLKNAIGLSQALKKIYPNSFIVFGGIHPTLAAEQILSYRHIDAVIRGEAEDTIIELYRFVKRSGDVMHIKGLSYKKNGQIIHNNTGPIQKDLDVYPAFPYHLFNHKRYDMGFVMSSRGCPHRCIFCSCKSLVGSRFYRYRSARAIIDDIELLYDKYNKRYVNFLDDNFLIDRKRIYELTYLIKQKGFDKKMNFSFVARADNIEYNLCEELYSAGFRIIILGLETASEKIMEVIKKGETVAGCIEGVKIVKKIGFSVSATFVYCFPGETHQDRMDCVKLSKGLKLDMVRFNNAIPYPGTELYEIAKSENRLNIQGMYENFIAVSGIAEHPFRKIPFAYVPDGNTEDEIRRDILISHLSMYFNLPKTIKIILGPAYGAKWFSLGDNFIERLRELPALFYLGLLLVCKFYQCIYYSLIKKETAMTFRRLWKILQ